MMLAYQKAIEILFKERACVDTDACDHKCGECMLASDKDGILLALDMAIDALAERDAIKDDGR